MLAGTVETAVNALWDAAPLIGDRVTVVGAGHGRLLRRGPAGPVPRRARALVDVDPARAPVADSLGVEFALARRRRRAGATWSCTPARSPAGLQRSLDLLAPEGTVLELSWYGDRAVTLPLGGAFHSGRLRIRSSQVGTVSPARAGRTFADRLALALDLLRDPAFDALITGASPFEELPDVLDRLATGALPALCHLITYDGE